MWKTLIGTPSTPSTGVSWNSFRGNSYSLKLTEMKMRPSN